MNEKNTLRAIALVTIYISLIVMCGQAAAVEPGCAASAQTQRIACQFDLRDDFLTHSAICLDSAVPDEACFGDAEEEFDEGVEECDDVLEARLELCEALDDATHEPEFGEDFAASFVDPLQIGVTVAPNPWFPLVTDNRWVYEGDGESIEVVVTGDTKVIDGVTCVVVIDTASEDDVIVETTNDWYAQDVDGNVWYCGEISENFEEFDGDDTEDPELVDIEGSWKAGRDDSEAGMLLPFDAQVGDIFRQEFAQTDAEDAIEVLAVDANEAAPGGACNNDCLLTRDFTPLEPGVEENKYYVPGIGLIVEIDLETGDRVELAEFTGVGQ
jgi:hypothetical protein